MSIAGTNPVSEREGNRRTFFLPKYWTVRDIMYPQETLSQCLLAVHDEEGEGGGDADGEHDKMRWELLTFSDELEQPVIINRSPEGDVIFEIDLDGVPLGHRHELGEAPILAEILEIAWDVAADCTLDSDRWMSNWYATHVIIKPWAGRHTEDQIVIRCTRADKG